MKRLLVSTIFLMATLFLTQGMRAQNSWQETMHHPSRMHHLVASAAKLDVADDSAAQVMTVRVGPVNLPAHTDHMSLAQPRELYVTIPFDGWLVAFHPRLVDAAGIAEPGKLLHHVAFWNTARPDFLCRNKLEHVFGAGGEMNDWPALPGFGYRVAKGSRIRVNTMFSNPTGTAYPKTYLEVRIEYRRDAPDAAPLHSVYPAWIDVMGCRDSGYDLKPGQNVTTGQIAVPYAGVLLGVGGHLHDYGRQLVLEDVTRKSQVAELDAQSDSAGALLSMPIVQFPAPGYRIEKGEVLRVTATYDNPTRKHLVEGAMGIVVGYFLPEDDAQLAALVRSGK